MRHMLCSLLQGIYIDTTDDMCKEMLSPADYVYVTCYRNSASSLYYQCNID